MRVCVVRLDALGDTLLSTPAIQLLRGAGHEVTVLTSPVGTSLLRGLAPAIEVAPDESSRAIATRIRRLQPDAALIFTEKRRGLSAAYQAGVPIRIGFDPGLTQPLKSLWLKLALTDRVLFQNSPKVDPGLHEVQRYRSLVEKLVPDLNAKTPGLFMEFSPEETRMAQVWVDENCPSRPLGLQLTPKWGLHGLTARHLRVLVEKLPRPLVGFYGPAEREWVEQEFRGLEFTRCYQPDLHFYAAILACCSALITVDTGAAHVAAAVGTPVLDVFPSENSEHCLRRWRPWQVRHQVLLSRPDAPFAVVHDVVSGLERLVQPLVERTP